MRYYIDIEDSNGNRLGSGPITSMNGWRSTARMDQAGEFAFSMPASDEQAESVAETRIARCYALLPGGWTEIGAGVIEHIDTHVADDGAVTLAVSGPDLLRELTYRSVGKLAIQSGGAAMTHAAAVAAAAAYAPSGWTVTAAGSPPCDSLYGQFADESVLAALAAINAKSQTHFYAVGRALTFASAWSASGVRAIRARSDLVAETAAIVALSKQRDSWDLITRIVPYGAGDGAAQLTLAATGRTAPTGYTLDKAANFIRNDTAEALYGRRERRVDFKDITPLSSTTADVQAAANMLYDSALHTLALLSAPAEFYALTLAECSTMLRPLQTLRLVYRDVAQRLTIDADLYILAATVEIDAGAGGLRTTNVEVATVDRWPASDAAAIVEQLSQSNLYQVHPQRNANLHTISYTKHVDETEQAEFRFRFDDDVLALSRVTFDFTLLALESTVKTVGLEQETGGTISTSYSGNSGASGTASTGAPSAANTGAASGSTGGPSTANTGAASGNTGAASGSTGAASGDTGGPSTVNTGAASGSTGAASGDTGGPSTVNTGAASGSTGAASGDTGGPSTINTGAASGSTGAASGSTGAPSEINTGAASGNTGAASGSTGAASGSTGGSGTLTTEEPDGTGWSGGSHRHDTRVYDISAPSGSPVYLYQTGGTYYFGAPTGAGSQYVGTEFVGSHDHDLDSHTHTLNSHTHDLGSHTHTLNSHTHGLNSHTHTLNNHTHDLGSHSHGLNSHTHTLNSHTHDLGSHSHGLNSHTHTLNSHTHDLGSHSHGLNSHTHTLNSHTHDLGSHTHDLGSHTHDLGSHTHTLNSHTHDLASHTHTISHVHDISHTHTFTPSVTTVYGIFRNTAGNTFALADLEYSVDGATWYAFAPTVNGYTSLGDGWYRIDITALVMAAGTFLPLAANNLLRIRRKSTGATGKMATIDAQMNIRSIIQAIDYQ